MRPPENLHDWVSFDDDEEDRTWLVDVTFLLSSWRCIFGEGCQGVLTGPTPELEQGCCSYGAHFTGSDDVKRVKAAAARLTAEDWQFFGTKKKLIVKNEEGVKVSAQQDGACIFLNRPGFARGSGCALHSAALAAGERPMDWKPDVCWQLPLRREDQSDSGGHVTSIITQWDRHHWGDGGAEFAWWCTEAPEAFTGATAVYESMGDELEALMGPKPYRRLVAELERRRRSAQPHPVQVAAPRRARRS